MDNFNEIYLQIINEASSTLNISISVIERYGATDQFDNLKQKEQNKIENASKIFKKKIDALNQLKGPIDEKRIERLGALLNDFNKNFKNFKIDQKDTGKTTKINVKSGDEKEENKGNKEANIEVAPGETKKVEINGDDDTMQFDK